MGVQHAGDIRARLVDRTVDYVARFVDAVVGLRFPNDLALDIDFGEARCRDFLVEHGVKVDQQVVLAARYACGASRSRVSHALRASIPSMSTSNIRASRSRLARKSA